jgi:hypothetical protein
VKRHKPARGISDGGSATRFRRFAFSDRSSMGGHGTNLDNKSYVHLTIVLAFENGVFEKLSKRKGSSSPARREAMLAQLRGRIAA